MTTAGKLVWLDAETTGLQTRKDRLLEVAIQVTNWDLEPIRDLFNIVVGWPEIKFDDIEQIVIDMHTENGLWDEVKTSIFTMEQASDAIISHLRSCGVYSNVGILAGSCVHFDREFLMTNTPEVVDYLDFRLLDISSIKTALYYWRPSVLSGMPRADGRHRARTDVINSIAQMKHIKDRLGPASFCSLN